MTDRLIIADARRVTPLEFIDALGLDLPERRARRKAEGAAFKRKLDEQHERGMMELRKRILSQFKTREAAQALLDGWAREGVDTSQLTECLPDPLPHLEPREAA